MPSRLGAPVLSVDADRIFEVDIRNAETLYGMWTGKAALGNFNLVVAAHNWHSLFQMC